MNLFSSSVLKTLLGALWLVSTAAVGQQPVGDQARGPLRIHPTNPRYFTDGGKNPDGSLRTVYLTGSHTWNNRLDIGRDDPPKAFNFDDHLDFLERHGHNFIRLWTWGSTLWDTRSALEWVEEGAIYHVTPQPWRRTGPGQALDGRPKFNLEQLDPAYFDRLRARVQAAGKRGIYVSVMLFEGWSLSFDSTSWRGHPFRLENNVQGINGDANGDGKGLEIQTLTNSRITALQEAYVRKVIDVVNDLDNVLYEISNESRLLNPASSTKDWQYHMIRFIKHEEAKKSRQHPVGMTSQGGGGGDDSEILRQSPADWISPNPDKFDYKNNPPASDGAKVVLLDTDHLWGVGGDAAWVWKSFLSGHNPLFMDPYEHEILGKGRPDQWEEARRAMGATRGLARRIDLAKMTPSQDLASTKYCLANPGQEYLVYQPGTGEFSVNLEMGNYAFEWFDPTKGSFQSVGSIKATGGNRTFTAPFPGPAVLYLKVTSAEARAVLVPKLGIFEDKFTLGGKPTFLLGVSYFDALGWSNADLDAFQARRFNLIRIFLDWSILDIKDGAPTPVASRGFVNPDGSLANTASLLKLVRACATRGIVVDVTILTAIYDAANPMSKTLDMPSRERAVRNAVRLLKNEPNVFFDVCNEHDVAWNGKTTTLTHDEVTTLIRAALAEHPAAIVTVSSGPDHLPSPHNIREELQAGVMLVTPHFQRTVDWYDQTDERIKVVKADIRAAGLNVPVYLQEEQRRGFTKVSPPKSEFLQAAREAVNSGAAGWVFHTHAGFDLRSKSLLENLDSVEREVLDSLGAAVLGAAPAQASNSPAGGPPGAHPVLHRDGVFTIRAVDRRYDLHRPLPVTTLTIEHRDWPGNWFCLWLPETVYEEGRNVWSNFTGGERTQRWTETNGTLTWRMRVGRLELTSALTPDAENNALWISHEFRNTSSEPLRLLSTQSCFHLVDAPQFISAFGERIWAKLDGQWMTTDQVGRLASPDPRRVQFSRHGLRPARVVKPYPDFPSAELLEEAHHPLIIAEAFGGKGAVGIGQRDYQHLFNNNDPILRCIHSEPKPIATLEPGAQAVQEGLIVFDRGDHAALVKRWERLARKRWGTAGEEARGPLRVHPTNPRYFADNTGKAIFLTGSHTWDSLQDWGGPTPNFDYPAYLDLLSGQGHNFIRLWIRESTGGNTSRTNATAPMPWARTGPGVAADGEPKFDLNRFNDAFFARLRSRVMAARDCGIYVSIMLFQQYFNLPTHPFAASNNVNVLSADLNGDGDGREIHTLGHPAALACQEAFVRKVIDAVNDLDNVLYEIGNEFERHTIAWQHHMINLIHSYEREKPKQHPVGMTSTGRSGTAPPRITNAELFASPADWISPHNEPGQNYASDPPAAEGRKIILADSDHLEGILGATDAETYRRWIWKSLFRGVQPILMDAIQNGIPGWEKEAWNQTSNPGLPAAREAMGRARAYAERLELAALVPRSDLASTRYCLAVPGKEYVVFLPEGGGATVDLNAASGRFAVEWYRVEDGKSQEDDDIAGGKEVKLASPWLGRDVVLRLVRK